MMILTRTHSAVALALALAAAPAQAQNATSAPAGDDPLLAQFDRVLALHHTQPVAAPALVSTTPWQPQPVAAAPMSPFNAQLAALADPHRGRIGVAALDLASGRIVDVLGDQRFPLASTGKVAIVATYLDGVDRGQLRLTDTYPLRIPVRSAKFSSATAPEREGTPLMAQELIERAITRSDNTATDALLAAIGGPAAVDRWLNRVGITGMHLDRNIGTLVRDDGEINPATTIDPRDSTTPQAMVQLLSGLYRGQYLSPSSRDVLLGAMSRCQTGLRRMRAGVPDDALIGHKTGTLANTSSDVGIIRTMDGHTLAVAIYVTGQGGKPGRESRIAEISHALYAGYQPYGGYQGAVSYQQGGYQPSGTSFYTAAR